MEQSEGEAGEAVEEERTVKYVAQYLIVGVIVTVMQIRHRRQEDPELKPEAWIVATLIVFWPAIVVFGD